MHSCTLLCIPDTKEDSTVYRQYIQSHTYIHTYIHAWRSNTSTLHIHTYINTCIHIHMYWFALVSSVHTIHIHTYIHTYIHEDPILLYTYIHILMRTYYIISIYNPHTYIHRWRSHSSTPPLLHSYIHTYIHTNQYPIGPPLIKVYIHTHSVPGLRESTRSSYAKMDTVCGVSPSGISSGVSCNRTSCLSVNKQLPYIHTYIHTYIHICIHSYIYTCIHTDILYRCINTFIHTYIHTFIRYIHTLIHIYTWKNTYTDLKPWTNTCAHKYLHTYIHFLGLEQVHTHIHTYT